MVQLLLTTVACDFYSARCSRHANNRTQLSSFNNLPIPTIVLKPTTFFSDVHDSRKRVVGLIYMNNSCRKPVVSLSHATKPYRVNCPLTGFPLLSTVQVLFFLNLIKKKFWHKFQGSILCNQYLSFTTCLSQISADIL